MAFDWIKRFQQNIQKPENYAEKMLAAYRLGMRAGGSLRGVRIEPGDPSCKAVQALDPATVYHPDEAPLLPLPGCSSGSDCRCVYRPVMSYEERPV